MKTILGTGQLGIAVMEGLLKANPSEEIMLVNRDGKLNIPLTGNVKLVACDVTNNTELEQVARKSDVIFNCTDVPYQLWKGFYPATAAALAYALEKTNARLVFADNMYSYGNVQGRTMHEDLPHHAHTRKGLIRTSVINTLLNSGKPFSERVAFVKAADFIGPRIYKGVFGTDFLQRMYSGKTVMLSGNLKLPHTFTYIHDFATALIQVGSSDDTFGQTWHVPNAAPITPVQWIKLFEKAVGKKVKLTVLPKFVVRIAGLFDPLIRELYELAYQFEYPYLVDHTKYITRFGNHSTAQSEIVKQTVKWYNSTLKQK